MQTRSRHLLDLRGLVLPLTLLKVTREFSELPFGEVLEVLGSDPDTRCDLLKVLPKSCYSLVGIEEMAEDRPYFCIRVQKTAL